jgi:hypothetical protein
MATTYPAGHATVAGYSQMILSYFFPPEALVSNEMICGEFWMAHVMGIW